MTWHPFDPGDEIAIDSAGRPYRLCRVCGRSGRGRGHPPAPGAPSFVNDRAHERAQDVAAVIEPVVVPVLRPSLTMAEGDERPKTPDWRLFAAYHAIVMAEDVRDLDSGLTLALKVAARELDYLLHRRPRAIEKPAELSPAARPVRTFVLNDPLPYIRDHDIRALAEIAVAQGFEWQRKGSGHLRIKGPDGRGFTISMTVVGSAARSLKNARAAARRAGVVV